MKLAAPKLSTNLEDATVEMMIDDGELEAARLHDEDSANCNVTALQLIDVRIEDVQFTGAHFSRIVARDVVVQRSDLSRAALDNGMLVRVEFVNCRMSRIDFSGTAIHDVVFRDCKLDEADFMKADLRRVLFENCTLDGATFIGASLVGVER